MLEARARILGADHPGTLTSRNNLALVLRDLGRTDEGETARTLEVDGTDRPGR